MSDDSFEINSSLGSRMDLLCHESIDFIIDDWKAPLGSPRPLADIGYSLVRVGEDPLPLLSALFADSKLIEPPITQLLTDAECARTPTLERPVLDKPRENVKRKAPGADRPSDRTRRRLFVPSDGSRICSITLRDSEFEKSVCDTQLLTANQFI